MSARRILVFFVVLGATLLPATQAMAARLQTKTVRAWDRYVALTEARISSELESGDGFLAREKVHLEDAIIDVSVDLENIHGRRLHNHR